MIWFKAPANEPTRSYFLYRMAHNIPSVHDLLDQHRQIVLPLLIAADSIGWDEEVRKYVIISEANNKIITVSEEEFLVERLA